MLKNKQFYYRKYDVLGVAPAFLNFYFERNKGVLSALNHHWQSIMYMKSFAVVKVKMVKRVYSLSYY